MDFNKYFKYLDLNGAKLTLRNQTFRHAKPSSFNDSEDLTTAGVFLDLNDALDKLPQAFIDVVVANLETQPTCESPIKEKVQEMQLMFQTNPEPADVINNDTQNNAVYNDTEYFHALADKHVQDINNFMQSYRVLCVTATNNSEEMWQKYAHSYMGIALRIEPNMAKDSKFKLFKPVTYKDRRPPLYKSVEEFVYGALFGNHESRCRDICEQIIFSKTRNWDGENEYRLAIPIVNEEPWENLSYYPEEITELYLGSKINKADIEEIVSLALEINPTIKIHSSMRDISGNLTFEPYNH